MKAKIKPGDNVKWTYKHYLNSKSFTYITKKGIVVDVTGAVKNVRYVSGSVAIVQFEGNKTKSKVPVDELVKQQ